MNVLDSGTLPGVMNLRDVLSSFLDHRHDVLVRRTRFRLGRIDRRLEILAGYMIVYLNLDEVIAIIRREDDPKPILRKRWKLNDAQAEAILNMRLRALRRLEEKAIAGELAALEAERKALKGLLRDGKRRWKVVAEEIAEVRKRFGANTALGRRRTEIGAAREPVEVPLE